MVNFLAAGKKIIIKKSEGFDLKSSDLLLFYNKFCLRFPIAAFKQNAGLTCFSYSRNYIDYGGEIHVIKCLFAISKYDRIETLFNCFSYPKHWNIHF